MRLILGGKGGEREARSGKHFPTLVFRRLGTDQKPLSKQPTVMSFNPRTGHKQIYIGLLYKKKFIKTYLLNRLDVSDRLFWLIGCPNPHPTPHCLT